MTTHRLKTKVFHGARLLVCAALIAGLALAAMPATQGRASAVHYVTKTTDSNDGVCAADCSLREAIGAAHPSDTIDFSLPPGSTVNITLGSIDTLKSFTISSSVANITIDAGNTSRIFYFWNGSTVLLDNLTLANGATTGGEHGGTIQNTSNLTLTDVTINTSTADGWGGGIYSGWGSTLYLDNVTLYDNHAEQGGGVYFRDNDAGTLTIVNSNFSSNDALEGNGGGLYVNNGDVNITSTTFDSNTASRTTASAAYGGGIFSYMTGGDTITINYSTISNNVADTAAVVNDRGGGIYHNYGTMTLNKTTVSGNTSYMGGGIYVNTNGALNVNQSTISGNLGQYGAGGVAAYGAVNMTNSTISGNKANNAPGAMYVHSTATANLNNVTITANVADFDSDTSGLIGGLRVNGGTITVRNSIIAGNTENTGSTSQVDCVIAGLNFTSGGYNLVGIADGCNWTSATGDQTGTLAVPKDPLLGSLADNGGPTYTHNLGGGSPAIEGGNTGGCKDHNAAAITVDQRGALRPNGIRCDIGSYEVGSVPKDATATTITSDSADPSVTGETVTVQYTVTTGGIGTPTGTVTVTDLTGANCNATVAAGQCDIVLPSAGPRLLTASYSGDSGHNSSEDNESHTVNKADTTTTVTSDNPDPSIVNQTVTVTFTVTADSPGSGTPTGAVLVVDTLSSATCYGIPLSGDWDGDGTDTIGVFSPSLGEFRLRNSNDAGAADITLSHPILVGAQPITGTWNGDDVDTIGIYVNGKIYLRNTNSIGQPDISFNFGSAGLIPLAGDWDGDGTDTIGTFDPVAGEFQLRNSNSTGPADITIQHKALKNRTPLAGDWDGDGTDTLGIYVNGKVLLRNTNSIGPADLKFNYGGAGLLPVTGNWDDS